MKKILIFILLLLPFLSNNVSANTSNISAGIVDTNGGNLNIRSNPSTSSSIVSKIKDNSYVTIHSSYNSNWYYVEYSDNLFGYAHKKYIDIVSNNERIVNTSGSNLNVRDKATLYSNKIGSIKNNDSLVVLSSNGYWSYVLYNGNKCGYVYNTYLKSRDGVRLDVSMYKQFDTRWSSRMVGSSGKSVRQIGCLITSMAISEEYYRGYTYTPINVLNDYSFTPSGSMYWPSNYNVISSTSNYKNIIIEQLKNNKPVILGCKNYNGSTHFIVIYSYSNSSDLKTFLISDPGSSTRYNLEQFLNIYPTFYKLAYRK